MTTDKEELDRLNKEMDEVFRRIAAAQAKLESYREEDKKAIAREPFRLSLIQVAWIINLVGGCICLGIILIYSGWWG